MKVLGLAKMLAAIRKDWIRRRIRPAAPGALSKEILNFFRRTIYKKKYL